MNWRDKITDPDWDILTEGRVKAAVIASRVVNDYHMDPMSSAEDFYQDALLYMASRPAAILKIRTESTLVRHLISRVSEVNLTNSKRAEDLERYGSAEEVDLA